jgi:hypothetical protein
MPNYNNIVIYKIVCKDLSVTNVYVGSTTNFRQRKFEHKSRINNKSPEKIYETIGENGGWDNWEMIEIEKYPCNDSNEARARERFHYEQLNANLNTYNPSMSNEERRKIDKNRNKNIERCHNWYETNKGAAKEYAKEYRQLMFECPCGVTTQLSHKRDHEKTKKHLVKMETINKNNDSTENKM